MSKTKKILSAVIALMLVLNVFAISAFAADVDTGNTQEWGLTVTELTATTYRVDVSLKTNYPTGAIQFKLLNSDSAVANFTSTSYVLGAAMPESYAAEISANPNTGLAVIVPQLTSTTPVEAVAIDGVIASFTYTYSGTGMATITLDNNPKTTGEDANVGGTLIAVRMASGVLNNGSQVVGQVVTITEGKGSVDIGTAAADPDLALKSTAADGIKIDTNKTFGGLYDGVVYGFIQVATGTFRNTTYLSNAFEATNNGTLAFVKGEATAIGGTGTNIQVKNTAGTVVKTYVVVIFGDVNCDGLINTNDFTLAKSAIKNAASAPNNSIKRMAANCQIVNNGNMMHVINANDVTPIKAHVGGTKLNAVALANAQYAYNVFYK